MDIFNFINPFIFRERGFQVLDIGLAGIIQRFDSALVYAFKQQEADFTFIQGCRFHKLFGTR